MKRPLAVPTNQISAADFMELQRVWDRKLARHRDEVYPDGFRDIEDGEDTNRYHDSTFKADEVLLGVEKGSHSTAGGNRPANFTNGRQDTDANVFSSPRARAWMLFSQAAHELPVDRRTRDILVEVGQVGSIRAVARRRRVSVSVVHRLALRLCDAIGVESANLFGPAVQSSRPHLRWPLCQGCQKIQTRGKLCPACKGKTQEAWWRKSARREYDNNGHPRPAEPVAA